MKLAAIFHIQTWYSARCRGLHRGGCEWRIKRGGSRIGVDVPMASDTVFCQSSRLSAERDCEDEVEKLRKVHAMFDVKKNYGPCASA